MSRYHGMYMHELTNDTSIPEKLYPDAEEVRRCEIARRLGMPLIPKVTETSMVRFFCTVCMHKFKVVGRVAMSGIFKCPGCQR